MTHPRRSPSGDVPYQTLSQAATPLEGALSEDAALPESGERPDARIRWVHFMLGCAVLLPWNVMITATPFFLSQLEGSSIFSLFSSYLSLSFTISSFLFLAHATAITKNSTPSRIVHRATLQLAALSLLLALSTVVHAPSGVFAAFVLLAGVAMAGAGAYLQTSVFAVASLFGADTMQAVMSGQAAVAIVISAVQLLSATASVHTTEEKDGAATRSARAFFALSTLFLVVVAGASLWMARLPAYKAVVIATPAVRARDGEGEQQAFLADEEEYVTDVVPAKDARARILDVAKRNILYELTVAYVFIVTLSVYPPITISVQPVHPGTNALIFSSIHFLVFNIGDFAGRTLCSVPALRTWSARRLLALSIARILFVPLFLLCNIDPSTTPFINSDALFFGILALFGISNGYVGSMGMMSAPSLAHNPRLRGRREDVDIAATVASFSLVGGLVVGSFASFGVRALMCRCNPFMG